MIERKNRWYYLMVSLSGLVYVYLLYQVCVEKICSFHLEIVSFAVAILFSLISQWLIFYKGKKWLLVPYLLFQIGIFIGGLIVYHEPRSIETLGNKYWASTVQLNMSFASILFFSTLFRCIKMAFEHRNVK